MSHLRDLPHKRKMTILAGVLLAMLLGALDATIVGPAMPSIVQELGGMALLSWVFTIYSLTSTITIPVVGKLSDLYGRKYFYLAGIAIFLVGSALCGAAGEPWLNEIFNTLTGADNAMLQLIVFRGLQGIGGGMMMANAMAIIGDLFDPRERGRYQGLTGAVFGLASVFGPAVGGWLTDQASWRWIFYINIPFGVVALVWLALTMPKPEHGQRHQVDWWGATALTAGLVPLLIALNWGGSEYRWDSSTILGLFAMAAVMLGLFIWREMRASEPILDMRLFRDRSFSASMAVLFLSGVGMFGSIMFLPTFMQIVQGRSAASSGALLTPMMISMIAGSVVTGQLISRTGRYKAYGLFGLAAATIGMLLLSRLAVDSANIYVITCMVLVGVGIGVTMPLFTISLQAQYRTRMGEVTGAMQFFRSIGGTVGVAMLGGVMNAAMRAELMERVGPRGMPQLEGLWSGMGGQPGPLSPQGLSALIAKFGDKMPAGGEKLFTDFVDALKVVVDGSIPRSFDPSTLLNTQVLAAVGRLIGGIEKAMPAAVAAQLGMGEAWARLVLDLKIALTAGVTTAFLYGAGLMGLAFIAMWFVREIPITTETHVSTAAEMGAEILIEEAVLPADDEPVLVGEGASGGTAGELQRAQEPEA